MLTTWTNPPVHGWVRISKEEFGGRDVIIFFPIDTPRPEEESNI